MSLKYVNLYTVLFFFFFLYGCALQLPPGGGEIDKTPPEVINAYPVDGTLHYDKDYIEFEFSEYVDKRKFLEALFISPAIEGALEIFWTNTTVTVEFPEKLKPNKTYTVTVGSDVADVHNSNKMSSSYTIRFSTGDRIDNGSISGTIYEQQPGGIMIYVYPLDSIAKGPEKVKPDYMTQSGLDGTFTVTGVAPGAYRVFAVKDAFKDFLFQPDQDEIGISHTDVTLSYKDSSFSGLNFRMQKIDTVYPRLLTSVMTDRNHVLLTFSEPVNPIELTRDHFLLIDSLKQTTTNPAGSFRGKTKDKEYVLVLPDTLKPSQSSYIIGRNFADLTGNKTIADTVLLAVSEKPDTTAPQLLQIIPQKNASDINFQNFQCQVSFDDWVSMDDSLFYLCDTAKNRIQTTLKKIDDASWILVPQKNLKAFSEYELVVSAASMSDYAGNSRDTIFVNRFKTMNDIDFSGVYGKISGHDSTKTCVLNFLNTADTSVKYQYLLPLSGNFAIKKMIPGKYMIQLFYDNNNNGVWDKGTLLPFAYAEEGMQLKEPLQLNARWSVTDYNLYVGKAVKKKELK